MESHVSHVAQRGDSFGAHYICAMGPGERNQLLDQDLSGSNRDRELGVGFRNIKEADIIRFNKD
jgi:hypothetical protein